MSWILFALLAAVFWSLGNITDKVVVSRLIKQPMTMVILLGAFSFLGAIAVWLCGGLERFTVQETMLALAGGVTYTVMNVCYIQAVRREEISKIIPLFALSPIMIALVAAVILREVFSLTAYAGIALILIGAVTLSLQRMERFRFNIAFWLMVGAAASITMTEVIQKYLLRTHSFWSVFAYSRLGSAFAIIPIAWIYRDELVRTLRGRKFKKLSVMSLSVIFNIAGLLAVVYASSQGYVTLVNVLTQVQPLIVLLFTVIMSFVMPHILKEEQSMKIFARKGSSILTMSLGVVLLLIF